MIIRVEKIHHWKKTAVPHPTLPCGLCGRTIKMGAPCLTAIWSAQGGQYVQAYHQRCADIVKLWGYPLTKYNPAGIEGWARGTGCNGCPKVHRCSEVYVLDCELALQEIRFRGGVRRDADEQPTRGMRGRDDDADR